jgi:hypothetical protein
MLLVKQRPRIGVALASEREILLQQLTEHLNAVDSSFDDFDRYSHATTAVSAVHTVSATQ